MIGGHVFRGDRPVSVTHVDCDSLIQSFAVQPQQWAPDQVAIIRASPIEKYRASQSCRFRRVYSSEDRFVFRVSFAATTIDVPTLQFQWCSL